MALTLNVQGQIFNLLYLKKTMVNDVRKKIISDIDEIKY